MAARGPGAACSLPRTASRKSPAASLGGRRRLRRSRGSQHADPRVHAGAAHQTPGEDELWPPGIVLRARAPAPVAGLDATWGITRWHADQRPGPAPGRWRRLYIDLA